MNLVPRPTNDIIDAPLVKAAQRGERVAFDSLIRRYRSMLLAVAYERTRDRDEAEDLVQNVLLQAWRKLPTLKEPKAFAGWLKVIMLNACKNWYRQAPRAESLDAVEENEFYRQQTWTPLDAALVQQRHDDLHRALSELPQQNRLPFMLHTLGQYTNEEIAEALGVSVTTVEGRVHRARKQLQRLLRDIPEKRTPQQSQGKETSYGRDYRHE